MLVPSARVWAVLALLALTTGTYGCIAPSPAATDRDRDGVPDDEDDDDDGETDDDELVEESEPLKPVSFDSGCEDRAAAFQALVQEVDAERRRQNLPGAGVAVVCRGTRVFSAGVGETKRGSGQRVTGQTTFNYASITKSLVATTAMRLAKRGRLELDGPVSAHVPGLGHAPYSRGYTFAELLAHTAGFPTSVDAASMDHETRIQEMLSAPLWSPPGAVHNYSNDGYLVAGFGLQQASGVELRDLIEREVMARAQMTNATMHTDEAERGPSVAFGHSDQGLTGPNDMYLGTTYYSAMGGAWGSAEDLARFAHQVMAGSKGNLLDDAAFAEMATPRAEATWGASWGIGFEIAQRGRFVTVSHTGGAPGFNNNMVMVPSEGFAFILLTNGSDGFIDLADRAFTAITGAELGEYPFVPAQSSDLSAAIGTYRSATLGELRVAAQGGGLALFVGRQGRWTPLHPSQLRDHYSAIVEQELGEETVRFGRVGGQIRFLITGGGVGER